MKVSRVLKIIPLILLSLGLVTGCSKKSETPPPRPAQPAQGLSPVDMQEMQKLQAAHHQ